jgi:hypothetical protein
MLCFISWRIRGDEEIGDNEKSVERDLGFLLPLLLLFNLQFDFAFNKKKLKYIHK